MNRSLFIKNLIGAAGMAAVPGEWVKTYHKFYLLQCFVAGFQFYRGLELLQNMGDGDMLQLVREPHNEFDSDAIALHWNENKIGFIPAHVNSVLAKLIDIQALELQAEIAKMEKRAASWENVAIAIYCLKETGNGKELPPTAQKLTILETPQYFSVKLAGNIIKRVKNTNGPEKIVVDISNLPPQFDYLRIKYQGKEYRHGDMWFDKPGMRILDDEDIEALLPHVKDIREVIDNLNQNFTQIIFDIEKCQGNILNNPLTLHT